MCKKVAQGHSCGATVQLQAIQEVFELFVVDEVSSPTHSSVHPKEQLFSVLLSETVLGSSSSGVLQFVGIMQQTDISILIDSGSTHFFALRYGFKLSGQFKGWCSITI
jgi:hypothetical protein